MNFNELRVNHIFGINKKEYNDLKLELHKKDILFVLQTISYSQKNIVFITGKMIRIENYIKINLSNLSNILNYLRIKELNIFSIQETKGTDEVAVIKGLTEISLIKFSKKDFLKFSSNPEKRLLDYNENSLYILRNGKYNDVKSLLRQICNCDVDIDRAIAQSYNVLSGLEFRLSCYLIAINHEYYNVNKYLIN